ncbi:hypothetical protein RB195_005647 [Necator americanus]|uniref:BAAT/acyl-CoA thioester hydrolase protein n=1 Tax=Necator americanus TaxID=51031 RepID=A0ABR1BRU9_NECAM
MSLYVDKPDTMQSEVVHILASDLVPNAIYKLVLRLRHKFGTHMSFAVFKADSAGKIDVPRAKPLRGTYDEADAMGLFMSVQPCDDFPYGAYLKCTPPLPFIYNLILLDSSCRELAMLPIKKHWMHPKLERTEIEEDGFCATLFKPPGGRKKPLSSKTVDTIKKIEDVLEIQGSMLASEGFVVLCVAFFQYKNLVETLEEVEVEYFKKPINWLKRQTFTNDRLGIQGVSFGGTIVTILASRYSQKKKLAQINAVVSINAPHVQNDYVNLLENGKLLPHTVLPVQYAYFVNGIAATDKIIQHVEVNDIAEIPWHRIPETTSFRLVASVDDLVSSSVFCSRYVSKRLVETEHNVEVHLVNGGHIMEPPYFPHHDKVYAKFQGFYCGYGGDVVLHGKSQEVSWAGTIDFFTRKLGQPAVLPEWKRLQHEDIKSSL